MPHIAERKGNDRLTESLWPWNRMAAWCEVQEVIRAAGGGEGPHAHAYPKGLRHKFGGAARQQEHRPDLNTVQKWLVRRSSPRRPSMRRRPLIRAASDTCASLPAIALNLISVPE